LALTENDVAVYGTSAKMNPPLRGTADREAILRGLADGTVDAIATDHAPHAPERKALPMATAPFGVIGLETAVAVALRELVQPGRISLGRMIELFTSGPAGVIHRPLGRLKENGPAHLTIIDPRLEWVYSAAQGYSKSQNSPFDGWRFRGAVRWSLVAGKLVYQRC
jgi:dihydroorotase